VIIELARSTRATPDAFVILFFRFCGLLK